MVWKGVISVSVPKEELHRLVDALPERATEMAKRFLAWIIDEESDVDPVPLTDEERAKVQRGERQIADGEFVTLETLEAEFRA